MSELKPFDWDTYAASVKAGEPLKVQTRDGREATQLARFGVDSPWCVVGVFGNTLASWKTDGTSGIAAEKIDLVFAPRTRTVWLAILMQNGGTPWAMMYGSAEKLSEHRRLFPKVIVIDEFTREIPA